MVHSYILANDTPVLSEMWVQKNQMSIHAVACNKADIHEDSWSGSGLTLYIYFCNDAMPSRIQISMVASLHTIKQGDEWHIDDLWPNLKKSCVSHPMYL